MPSDCRWQDALWRCRLFIERLRRGMVCDYLRVQKGPGPLGRYVYNLADLAIFTGALGLVLSSRRDG